ncbi:MAG: rhodanese-like domain-containing protein [Gemmatimonadaceae bacterium]
MNHRHVLAAVAATLALGAALTGSRTTDVATLARQIQHEDDHVTALELAQWIKDRKPGLRVLDIRSDSEFNEFHIPSAERLPLEELTKLRPKGNETLVLYSEGGAHAAQGWVLLRSVGFDKVYFLKGGLLDWMDDVMSPMIPEAGISPASDSMRVRVGALSRYFGGLPRVGIVPLSGTHAQPASLSASIARTRRRGC